MIAPYDHEHLFDKAKLFINRAMAPTRCGNFEENALWASLAIELLGKAALAKINPLLIAEPVTDDGKSMLIAAGINGDQSGFRSIPVKAVFARCAKAFPPFSDRHAMQFAHDRNAYLHSASGFNARFPEDVWWSRFWSQATLLLSAQDKKIEDLVGSSQVKKVEGYLAKNKVFIKELVQSLMERAGQRIQLIENNAVSARVAAEIQAGSKLLWGSEYETNTGCPVCANPNATLGGNAEEDSDVVYDEDGPTVWLTIGSDLFFCDRCGLQLDNYQYIAETSIPTSFDVIDENPEPVGEEYQNE